MSIAPPPRRRSRGPLTALSASNVDASAASDVRSPKGPAPDADAASPIQVLVRIRPALTATPRCTVTATSGTGLTFSSLDCYKKTFHFDHLLPASSSQDDVFRAVGEPLCAALLDGFNGTVFSYGQTGAGKTYTMFGATTGPTRAPRGAAGSAAACSAGWARCCAATS